MEKHYTPEIQEFYVGFEYEVLEKAVTNIDNFSDKNLQAELEEDSWFKFKYPDPYLGYNLPKLFEKEIRVKYLDQEDFEELGFEKSKLPTHKKAGVNVDVYRNGTLNLVIGHYTEIHKISTITLDPSKSKKLLETNWDEHQINLISINNKSELKRLLKQINL